MRVHAVGTRAGIEVEFGAAEPSSLIHHPVQQLAGVALAPMLWPRAEIVAVENVTPIDEMQDAKTGHGGRLLFAIVERSHQPVTLGPLDLVDTFDERSLIAHGGS